MIFKFYILFVFNLSRAICARVQYRSLSVPIEDTPVAKQAALLHSLLNELNLPGSNGNRYRDEPRETEKARQEKLLILLKKNYEAHRMFGEQAKSMVRTAHISNPEIIPMYRPQVHPKLAGPPQSDEDYTSTEPELPNLKNILRNVRREIDDTDIKRRYLSLRRANDALSSKATERTINPIVKDNQPSFGKFLELRPVNKETTKKSSIFDNIFEPLKQKPDLVHNDEPRKPKYNNNDDSRPSMAYNQPKYDRLKDPVVYTIKKPMMNEFKYKDINSITKRTTRFDPDAYLSYAQTTRRELPINRQDESNKRVARPFAGTPMQMLERSGIYEDEK